jgi:hypothetical protein
MALDLMKEGGREGYHKIYQYGSSSHWVMNPINPNLDPLRFLKCLENLEYAHVPSYQSRI